MVKEGIDMSYNIIDVWCAHGDSGSDRGGLGPIIAVCSTPYQADQEAKGQGWYGGNGGTTERKALRTEDGKVWLLDGKRGEPIDLDGLTKKYEQQRRQQLLDAMCDEDKRILGLTDK